MEGLSFRLTPFEKNSDAKVYSIELKPRSSYPQKAKENPLKANIAEAKPEESKKAEEVVKKPEEKKVVQEVATTVPPTTTITAPA